MKICIVFLTALVVLFISSAPGSGWTGSFEGAAFTSLPNVPMPNGNAPSVRDMRGKFPIVDEEGSELEQAFMQGVLGRMLTSGKLDGIDPSKFGEVAAKAGFLPSQDSSAEFLRTLQPPMPGDVGYGFWYKDEALHWSNLTVIIQSMVIPRRAGGDLYYYLYNTATNRSELGVEAFLSYYSQSDVHFKVFDWARPDHWQTDISYSNLGDYIRSEVNPDGVWRQFIKVVNATRIEGGPNQWSNEVYLYNQFYYCWDWVYQYSYTTSDPTENTFEPGDFFGSWGPIFETFQDHDGSNNPIGWDDTWLFQDGSSFHLTPENSWLQNSDPDLYPPIYLSPNWAWAVGSTLGEPANQIFEAEDGDHEIGRSYGQGWYVLPSHGEGWMLEGPGWTFSPYRMNAEFHLGIGDSAQPGDLLALVGVWDDTDKSYAASDFLYRSRFPRTRKVYKFRYDFLPVAGHSYWFVIYVYGRTAMGCDKVVIVKN